VKAPAKCVLCPRQTMPVN